MNVADLIRASRISTPEDIAEFHRLRKEAFNVANRIFDERAASYNVDHEPGDEMVYGAVSLASEMFKRVKLMCGVLSPVRQGPLTAEDIARLEDTCVDTINYASWQYALVQLTKRKFVGR